MNKSICDAFWKKAPVRDVSNPTPVNNGGALAAYQGAHLVHGFVYLTRWLLARGMDHENGCSLSPRSAPYRLEVFFFLCGS